MQQIIKAKYLLPGVILMMLFTLITYANHFNNTFHFDDAHAIQNNVYIRNINNIPLFFKDGKTSSVLPQNQSYRPVVTTSLAIDYWLGKGYSLVFFHLSVFIIFLAQGLLMFLFFRAIFNKADYKIGNAYIALIAATWYLVHPAIAETVNYIIARSDLLSTFFVLVAFVLYVRLPFCRRTYLYMVPVALGALAKPPAVMFAPLLFLYILLFEANLSLTDVFKKQHLKQLWRVVIQALPAFIFCGLLYLVVTVLTPKTWEAGGASAYRYLITQPFVVLHYFGTLFLPTGLSADSDWKALPGIGDARFFIGSAFVLGMLAIAVYCSKNKVLRPITFGILWFFLALIPSSSIIPLAEVLNDHRMYFPYVGLIMSVSWIIALLVARFSRALQLRGFKNASWMVGVPIICLLPVYAYGTYQRNKVWHTEESLWYDVTIKSPGNGRGLMNYGLTKMARGDYKAADVYFNRALKLLPAYSYLYINMGILKDAEGDRLKAESDFQLALMLGNHYPDAHYFYAVFLNKQLRYKEAVEQLKQTIALSPSYLQARLLLMQVYLTNNNRRELKELGSSTLSLSPGNAIVLHDLDIANSSGVAMPVAKPVTNGLTAEKYIDLSLQYYNAGKYQQCIEACGRALSLRPGYDLAYNNICASYNNLKEWDKAVAAGEEGLKHNPQNLMLKNNLAVAYKNRK